MIPPEIQAAFAPYLTAIALFGSTFLLVFFLGLQSLNVNRGHRMAAFITSYGIGLANLALFKLAPEASGFEILAFLSGGPFGIVFAMQMHPTITRLLGRRDPAPHG